MSNKLIRYSIILFCVLAVVYPMWIRWSSLVWMADKTVILNNLFPMFGLIAFSLLWLHSLSGVFEGWMRRYINFDLFISITASIILGCIILHPLLLLIMFSFKLKDIYATYGFNYILLGIIGWTLLITYDIAKPLKRYDDFFVRNWNTVLIISNIGFVITFFHSLYIGSDLQTGPLRIVWIFYGVTAMLSLVYTYAIKRILKNPA